jgi:hypothetical protein
VGSLALFRVYIGYIYAAAGCWLLLHAGCCWLRWLLAAGCCWLLAASDLIARPGLLRLRAKGIPMTPQLLLLSALAAASGGRVASGRSSSECVITDAPFSAIPDNTTVNTAAIQGAIDACHAAHPGGARVVVPAGAFKTGSLELRSNMELHIAKGAGLYGSTDPADYPIVQVRKLNGPFSSLTFLR